ncbi:Z-DNA-binding protein 1 isoform X2 [Pelodiscus sinensis]
MAKATHSAEVEQLVLDHIRTAAPPQKAYQIAHTCSITKQEANKVLYKLRKEGKVEKNVSHKWVVRAEETEGECHQKTTELKTDDTMLVSLHQPVNALMPVKADSKLTEIEDQIYKFLSENGPQNALAIAKHLGKTTRKAVNADLYALQKKHLLNLEDTTNLWSVYREFTDDKATSLGANKAIGPVIIQNNPTNIIYQGGVQNTVSIAASTATQIGNYNSLNLVDKKDDNRPSTPSPRAESENANTLHCEVEAATQGGQEINIIESTLKNTVIGDDNQMNIILKDFPHSPEEHVDQGGIPEKNQFGDFLTSSLGPSLKIVNTHPRDGSAPLQRVSIDKSKMENVMLGNSNKLNVHDQRGSAGLAEEETNEEDDGSDCNLTAEQSERTSCDDSGVAQPCDVSLLCEKLHNIIIGNNNYMNVEEAADLASEEEDEDE